jgi:hypothetical protein
MKRIRPLLGYAWAVLALFVVVATFMGNRFFSRAFASATGIAISARYSGGEIRRTVEHGAYRTLIHRPVFDGLLGEHRDGFIQINWEPLEGIPPIVEEKIDYDGDGKNDFLVRLDTGSGRAELTGLQPSVRSVDKVYRLRKGWVVRVLLRRPNEG